MENLGFSIFIAFNFRFLINYFQFKNMEAYIVSAYRSAVGKAKKGGFKFYRSDDLAVDVVEYMMKQMPNFDGKLVDDVIVGCANPEGEQGFQIGRQVSVRALGKEVPGMTVNRYCASGLETISIAVAKIRAGMGHCYIAGGTESMSLLPMTGYKLAPSYNVAMSTPNYLASMGATAEAVAEKWDITRDQADEFSYNSHMKAIAAIDGGKFKDEIVPVNVSEVYVKNNKRVTHDFVVDTDASSGELAGVRWMEFRQSADNQPWSLYQEGDFTAILDYFLAESDQSKLSQADLFVVARAALTVGDKDAAWHVCGLFAQPLAWL